MQHEVRLRQRQGGRHETVTFSLVPGATLMDAARGAGLPIASACDGSCLCARCGLEILSGREHVSMESAREAVLKRNNRIEPGLRLACLARVKGPVEVTASYW